MINEPCQSWFEPGFAPAAGRSSSGFPPLDPLIHITTAGSHSPHITAAVGFWLDGVPAGTNPGSSWFLV